MRTVEIEEVWVNNQYPVEGGKEHWDWLCPAGRHFGMATVVSGTSMLETACRHCGQRLVVRLREGDE